MTVAEDPTSAVFRKVRLGTVDSTNAEAWRRHSAGERGPLWITADRQTAGRGRGGRGWASESGNLFCTLLIGIDCLVERAPQLSFVTAIAVFDAVKGHLPSQAAAGLCLKWPNDLLHDGRKLAGVLIESSTAGSDAIDVVIGVGINVARHPDHVGRETISLAALGSGSSVPDVFATYSGSLESELRHWRSGAGFTRTKTKWLERATELGSLMSVNTGQGAERGTFSGLDHDGALLLKTEDGAVRRVGFGDVELVRPAPNS